MTLASAPRHPDFHLFEADGTPHLFLTNGSRIFAVDDEVARALQAATRQGGSAVPDILVRFGLAMPDFISDEPAEEYETRALSLAVAQKCNLGCTYCYADGGAFGEAPRNMPLDVALAAVDAFLREAQAGARYNLAFLGGEPLANRAVLRAAVERARRWSAANGAVVTFSITTNGTLVTPEDAAFFAAEGFAVTVSLDGVGETHDRQRPFKGGRGSFYPDRRAAEAVVERTWRASHRAGDRDAAKSRTEGDAGRPDRARLRRRRFLAHAQIATRRRRDGCGPACTVPRRDDRLRRACRARASPMVDPTVSSI